MSPQTERRMCCASREPSQNFQQYIDSDKSTSQKYIPLTLEEHWNSTHMKDVRRRMLAGETLPECDICNSKLLNMQVYRNYFNSMFGDKYGEALLTTTPDGETSMRPVSWDYRFSNLCNFKCRMCGDMLSSQWENENKLAGKIDLSQPRNFWLKPEVRNEISEFHDTKVQEEFSKAVEAKTIEEIYWAGGEPLMFEEHWRYMNRIIELGYMDKVYVRYNTNLSRISYKDTFLFNDLLHHTKDWQLCASIDGTGMIGEYIRTGLVWTKFLEYYKEGLSYERIPQRQMRLDFTLTLPGMFEIVRMCELAVELNTRILTKVVLSFDSGIIMSPLALPKALLHKWIDELLAEPAVKKVFPMIQLLLGLKNRKTFEEEWPDSYRQDLRRGKDRMLDIDMRRKGTMLADILAQRKDVHDWYIALG